MLHFQVTAQAAASAIYKQYVYSEQVHDYAVVAVVCRGVRRRLGGAPFVLPTALLMSPGALLRESDAFHIPPRPPPLLLQEHVLPPQADIGFYLFLSVKMNNILSYSYKMEKIICILICITELGRHSICII